VGDRVILGAYLNSASKNTPETDIVPHGTKPFLTSVITHFATTLCTHICCLFNFPVCMTIFHITEWLLIVFAHALCYLHKFKELCANKVRN
jgi:hypothetical protein